MKRFAMVSVCLCAIVLAQDPNLTFEVASVRPSGPSSPNPSDQPKSDTPSGQIGGPGTGNPGRIFYYRVSLQRLIMNAYGVETDQISGPDWLASEKFDIKANIRKGATEQQVNVMLQNLLIERFKLALHHATKEGPVYELRAAGSQGKKSAAKLKDAAPGLHTRVETARTNGLLRKTCHACTVRDLIEAVQGYDINRLAPERIVDKTGLPGKYDFTLEYLPSTLTGTLKLSAVQSQNHTGQDVFNALETQLGLTLERSRAPVDLVIVDHVEKTPSEN